jgi:N6-adenosine-specific RNA methylase IME4
MKSIDVGLGGIAVNPQRLRALRQDKVADLARSMHDRGLLQPIVLRTGRGARYTLVAGWHRLEAAKLLKWNQIRATVHDGMKADAAELAEIDENLIRADLSPAERAMHVARRKELYERAHPETKATKAGGPGRGKTRRQNGDDIADRFTKDAAKKTGRSERSMQREVERANKIVDLAGVIGTSLDEGDELDTLAKLPDSVQRDLIARAKAGERVTAKHVAKKLTRERREVELAEATKVASVALGQVLAAVALIDPPWYFELWDESGRDKCADMHYPCMSLDEIKALELPLTQDAVVFLWATVPMLPHALEVLAAWDFTYKSALFWIKDREGTGYWVRNRVELLLIATRGNVPAPAPGEQPPQVIEAPRREHSRKPDEVYEIIEKMFPTTPKLEMFARAARPGWLSWGNEVGVAEAAE